MTTNQVILRIAGWIKNKRKKVAEYIRHQAVIVAKEYKHKAEDYENADPWEKHLMEPPKPPIFLLLMAGFIYSLLRGD